MRTMNTTVRKDEKTSFKLKPESENGFNRLAEKLRNPNAKWKNGNFNSLLGNDPNGAVQKSSKAVNKDLQTNQEKWLKQRGINDKKGGSFIAKQILKMINPDGFSEIFASDFSVFLIEIGVPLSPPVMLKAVEKLLNSQKRVTEDHVSLLCRGEKRTNQILTNLNSFAANHFNKPFPDITSADQENLINIWWNELNSSKNNQVPANTICGFLVKTEIFSEFAEGKKFLDKLVPGSFLDQNQFKLIFALSLIKYALINIEKKFSLDDWENPAFSFAYKFCQLKRQMILAGIQYPIPHISLEEGVVVLKALENLAKFNRNYEPPISYKEFKLRWLRQTGKSLDKIDEKLWKNKKTEYDLAVFIPKELTDQTPQKFKKTIVSEVSAKPQPRGNVIFRAENPNSLEIEFTHMRRRTFKPINSDEKRSARFSMIFSDFQKVINNC